MADLSKEEKTLFEKLKKKMEAPSAQPTSRSIRANIDLGDPAQIRLARKLGFLDPEEGEEEEKEEEEEESAPRRRGYFADKEKEK